MKDVINFINKKYVKISNRVTSAYEDKLGLPCDLYFPIFPAHSSEKGYRNMKIFSPHQSPTYSGTPDVEKTYFYIPFLIKKDAMNSSEAEFDSFYNQDSPERPFIETTKKRELPIATKVVVHQGESIIKFFVDKKLVITGADGMMLLRMYLSPLAKDDDGEIEEQEETTVEDSDCSPKSEGIEATLSSPLLSSTIKGTIKGFKKKENPSKVVDTTDNLEMVIPEDD